jgi:hypothetical protein
LSLFSCKRDEEEQNDIYMLNGRYTLVSLTSNIALDLNHDGVVSPDMLQELGFTYDYFTRLLDIKESLYFDGWVPTTNFWPQFDDYVVDYTPLPFSGRILKYSRNTNALEYEISPPSFVHVPLFPEDIDTRTAPIVTKMEVLPDMKIKITIKHRFAEHPETYPDCWENVVLTAVYEKM